MSTYRIYSNEKRVATGKEWNKRFLQVYPEKKEYRSQAEWNSFWAEKLRMSIRQEEVKVAQPQVKPQVKPQEKRDEGWTYVRQLHFTAPAGTYYVGDLCYALHSDIYDNVFGGEAYERGLYSKGNSFFLVDGTSCGDGEYEDDHGRKYLVDAGIIGICSQDLIDRKNPSVRGGQMITFKNPFQILFKEGKFSFHDFTNGDGLTILT